MRVIQYALIIGIILSQAFIKGNSLLTKYGQEDQIRRLITDEDQTYHKQLRRLLQEEETIVDPNFNFLATLPDVNCSTFTTGSPEETQILDIISTAAECPETCAEAFANICNPAGGAFLNVLVSQVGTFPISPFQELLNTLILAPECLFQDVINQIGEIQININSAGRLDIPPEGTSLDEVSVIDRCAPVPPAIESLDEEGGNLATPEIEIIQETEALFKIDSISQIPTPEPLDELDEGISITLGVSLFDVSCDTFNESLLQQDLLSLFEVNAGCTTECVTIVGEVCENGSVFSTLMIEREISPQSTQNLQTLINTAQLDPECLFQNISTQLGEMEIEILDAGDLNVPTENFGYIQLLFACENIISPPPPAPEPELPFFFNVIVPPREQENQTVEIAFEPETEVDVFLEELMDVVPAPEIDVPQQEDLVQEILPPEDEQILALLDDQQISAPVPEIELEDILEIIPEPEIETDMEIIMERISAAPETETLDEILDQVSLPVPEPEIDEISEPILTLELAPEPEIETEIDSTIEEIVVISPLPEQEIIVQQPSPEPEIDDVILEEIFVIAPAPEIEFVISPIVETQIFDLEQEPAPEPEIETVDLIEEFDEVEPSPEIESVDLIEEIIPEISPAPEQEIFEEIDEISPIPEIEEILETGLAPEVDLEEFVPAPEEDIQEIDIEEETVPTPEIEQIPPSPEIVDELEEISPVPEIEEISPTIEIFEELEEIIPAPEIETDSDLLEIVPTPEIESVLFPILQESLEESFVPVVEVVPLVEGLEEVLEVPAPEVEDVSLEQPPVLEEVLESPAPEIEEPVLDVAPTIVPLVEPQEELPLIEPDDLQPPVAEITAAVLLSPPPPPVLSPPPPSPPPPSPPPPSPPPPSPSPPSPPPPTPTTPPGPPPEIVGDIFANEAAPSIGTLDQFQNLFAQLLGNP